jgi:hypothetical protein
MSRLIAGLHSVLLLEIGLTLDITRVDAVLLADGLVVLEIKGWTSTSEAYYTLSAASRTAFSAAVKMQKGK